MALEVSGANGPNQCALACLIRAGEDVQARLDVCKLERRAKLPQLGDTKATEPHGVTLRAFRSARRHFCSRAHRRRVNGTDFRRDRDGESTCLRPQRITGVLLGIE